MYPGKFITERSRVRSYHLGVVSNMNFIVVNVSLEHHGLIKNIQRVDMSAELLRLDHAQHKTGGAQERGRVRFKS